MIHFHRSHVDFLCPLVLWIGITAAGWISTANAQSALPSPVEFVPDPLAVTRHGPAWKYPQAGWTVLHIEGAPYERGYQHGHLLAAEIVDYITTLADNKNPKGPSHAWNDFRLLCRALFLKRIAPEWLEEMKGIADGAAAAGAKFDSRRLDLLDILAINAEIEASFLEAAVEVTSTGLDSRKFSAPQYSHPKVHKPDRCSAFIATGPATRDGKIVAGHITMSELWSVRHYNVWLDIKPAKGHRVVFQTFPGGIQSGMDYYLCGSGLIVAETTITQTGFHAEGESLASRIRQVVQYANSIDEAVEILKKSSNGLYTNEWLFGDTKTNEIAMLELGIKNSKLWRSSKNEWPGGTTGFYWGCNSPKDQTVLLETVPDMKSKPANLVIHPERRDVAWQNMFRKHNGKIDESFGFEAFASTPLAAFPSCDAKLTTAAMAGELKSWARFGNPTGRTWEVSHEESEKNSNLKDFVSNDWTLLSLKAPLVTEIKEKLVDLAPFPEEEKTVSSKFDERHPFAWRGTLLPKTAADDWLIASFAEYEKIVSFEKALRQDAEDHVLNRISKDALDLATFTFESAWFTAVKKLGHDVPLNETKPDFADTNWYPIAVGKGIRLLSTLRAKLGAEAFDKLMDEFGMAHGGKEVSIADFRGFMEKAAGKMAGDVFILILDRKALTTLPKVAPPVVIRPVSAQPVRLTKNIDATLDRPLPSAWSIYSFDMEPEKALIVYGTKDDADAQREAATLLQKNVMRRFHNQLIAIKSDKEVSDEELKSHHILLIGKPSTNRHAAQVSAKLPVSFGKQSFSVRSESFAHPESAVIVAGDNPWNSRYSTILFAGLSAHATRHCVQLLSPEDMLTPQVIVSVAGKKVQKFRVRP